jgi:hypothetical protein
VSRAHPGGQGVVPAALALLLAVALALGLGASACAGAPVSTPSDPWQAALARSREGLELALARALETSDDQEVLTFAARHNPAPCECPAWEIAYRGHWTRVFLEVPPDRSEVLGRLAGVVAAERDGDKLRTWSLTGRLSADWRRDSVTGLRYPLFTVEEVAERQ